MARRKFDIFSMSFLDTICCAFGALVLLYMIINASANKRHEQSVADVQAEVDKLEEQVLEGYANLVVARNSTRETEQQKVRTEGLSDRVLEETERLKLQLAEADKLAVSRREAIEKLKADLKELDESQKRLTAGTPSPGKPGNRVKGFVGTGDRQYLSGLKLGGERIVILVDASASMLDETVVNVIRMRNMPEGRRLRSEKWRRTVSTVDWLTAQIPAKSRFQVIAFNTRAWTLAKDGKTAGPFLQGLRETQFYLDGRTVLYVREGKEGSGLELRAADLESGADALLYKGWVSEPTVAPNGRRISFLLAESHLNLNLFTLDLVPGSRPGELPRVVGEPRAVTEGKGRWHVHNGSLSADGSLAAYTRDTDTADIFAISGALPR